MGKNMQHGKKHAKNGNCLGETCGNLRQVIQVLEGKPQGKSVSNLVHSLHDAAENVLQMECSLHQTSEER